MRNGIVKMTPGFFQECDQLIMDTVTFNKENVNSFHRAISSEIVTAQCFGLLPVLGITAPNAASLRQELTPYGWMTEVIQKLNYYHNVCQWLMT